MLIKENIKNFFIKYATKVTDRFLKAMFILVFSHFSKAIEINGDMYFSIVFSTDLPIDTDGDMYFGGLPGDYALTSGATEQYLPFNGCIGDVTVNGALINFVNSKRQHAAQLDVCPSSDVDLEPEIEAPGKRTHLLSLPINVSSCNAWTYPFLFYPGSFL